MTKTRNVLIGITMFTMLDVVFSFFYDANSVFMQTFYGVCKLSLFVYILLNLDIYNNQLIILRNVLSAYWIGGIVIYLYAFVFYSDLEVEFWADHLNDYHIIIPIYSIAILTGLIHARWKKW